MRLPAVLLLTVLALGGAAAQGRPTPSWPAGLPVYDHVVIVIEENKDYREIVGNPRAPYLNDVLLREGASFARMYAEEHNSEGNYFWLFSGSNQGVGFEDRVPSAAVRADYPLAAPNLASQLIAAGRSFTGYAEGLPAPGSTAVLAGTYARKHVPYISFGNVPAACNQPFTAFPAEGHFDQLPTVAFVLPDLDNDMHNCVPPNCASPDLGCCITKGDTWLRIHFDAYLRWARTHNSLLILTFDESDDRTGYAGLTNPALATGVLKSCRSADSLQLLRDIQNRIVTIAAGAHIRPGQYPEGRGITHVNLLRTLEAMYGLPRAGAQQPNAAAWGLSGDTVITDIFRR